MTEYVPPAERTDLLWAAIDFDGTLCESMWSPQNPNATPGKPIKRNIAKLQELVDHGMRIVIHTSRSWAAYEIVESWLDFHKIPYRSIVCGKLLAKVYVDDRGVHSEEPSWL